MNDPIYPCIWFDGNAMEAASNYCSAFKNSTIVSSNPMVVMFEIMGKTFMGLNGGANYKPNPSISFYANCLSTNEVNSAWQNLIVDGQVLMPLDKYPWSDCYGWLQDKYGVSWQITVGQPGAKPKANVFPNLLFTGIQNGKAETAINFYTSLFKHSSIELISRYQKEDDDIEGHIKFGEFTLDKQTMSIMDSSHDHSFNFNPGISLVITCDTQDEIDYYWLNLTKDGREDRCGWCQDSFGVSWQIVPSILQKLMSDPKKAPKVVEAFMKMKKFDIQMLKDAGI